MKNIFFITGFKKALLILFFSILLYSCKSSTETEVKNQKLELITSHSIQIDQPSGIAFNNDYTSYWIVSGGSERIYKTDLNGNILETLSYKGNDPEGIYYDANSSSLWIVEEELREIVQVDLTGKLLNRNKTNITGSYNNGLEGITVDENGNVYLVNEKNPRAIFMLDKDFKTLKKIDFEFSEDISDIYYNRSSKNFFILSDESKALLVWNAEEGLKSSFPLPFTKAEGITANPAMNKIIIVNDSLNTMYEYELKQ